MLSLLERIKQGELWDFQGGIHPPGRKTLSNGQPIEPAPVPHELVIPVKQHIGRPGHLLVKVGDRVCRGQQLTEAQYDFELPVHASSSGEVIAIEPRPVAHPSALPEQCVVIRTDGQDQSSWMAPIEDYRQAPANALIERIQLSGIAGLGGAGFPTPIKLQAGRRGIDLLIINAAECEPYITADDRLIQDYTAEVLEGITILKQILQPKLVLIGIEDDMPEAIQALNQHNRDDEILVRVLPTKYPSGGERQLIEVLTGKQVPQGGIPADIGMLVHNVGSAYAIKRAVVNGEPLTERVVTLTGERFPRPQNLWVRIGTPIEFLVQHCGLQPSELSTLIMGGPMMGFTLPHAQIPVVKITNCLLAPAAKELVMEINEQPCIRCSACAEACPAALLPQQLLWYAKADDKPRLEEHNLFDCIECGACAYVCPSEIPLVHYYRQAKAAVRRAREEEEKAKHAKARFEARKARLEREKHEREERHRKAAAARLEAMKQSPAGSEAVAEALARVQAKRQAAESEEKPMAQLREERKQLARQRKAEKADTSAGEPAETDPRKAAVAAAIARAKARKAAAADSAEVTPASSPAPDQTDDDPRKAAVAAAIARAKARKAAAADSTEVTPASSPAPEQTDDDPRKAAVAAAIARAKARKAAAAGQSDMLANKADNGDNTPHLETHANQQAGRADTPQPQQDETAEAPRNAAVARAIAKAKARQAQPDNAASLPADTTATANAAPTSSASASGSGYERDKSNAVARAVAKAKARKLAEQHKQDKD